MKIGIIVRRIKRKDGIQQEALALAHELQRMHHSVTVYTYEYEKTLAAPELIAGLRIVALPRDEMPASGRFLGILSRPSYLVRWQRRNRAARRLAFLIDRDTDLLNPHSMNTYPVSAYFKKEIKDIPCVWLMSSMALHSWKFRLAAALNPQFRISLMKRLFYRIMDELELKMFVTPHRIVVLSEQNKIHVKKWMGKDASLVRTGTDITRFHFKARQPLSCKKANILLTGKLFAYRRFEDAIAAIKILIDKGYDLQLTIVGAYDHCREYHQKLFRLVCVLGLESKVHFLGFVPEVALERTYQSGDLTIYPAVMQEGGIGLTALDTMACGVPLIVSRGAGASEVLADRVHAFFVAPKAPEEIASAIEVLFKTPDLYIALGKNGRKLVEEKFTWTSYARSIEKIFKEEVMYR